MDVVLATVSRSLVNPKNPAEIARLANSFTQVSKVSLFCSVREMEESGKLYFVNRGGLTHSH